MRYAVIVFLVLAVFVAPTLAQTTFEQGFYEFESTIASMTYTGTWVDNTTNSVVSRQTTTGSSSVSFNVRGKTLIVWRYMFTATNTFNLCVNGGSCQTITSNATSFFWAPVAFVLPSGTNTVSITRVTGNIALDSFMILADPATVTYPTPVPTATILPSSTPAFTATPQPTSTPGNTPVPTATILPSSTPAFTATPQPTATPYELPAAIWAIDPAARYSSTNGQITATRYNMGAPDYIQLFLLTALLVVNLVALGVTLWKRK